MSYLSIEILISLLKQYKIKKLVLSSGMRNIPFVSSVEVDDFFHCYSVVDERNAAFFALGLSQMGGNEPVAIACTSGTAASNYLTGITEAYYSHAPIVVITFDRSTYVLDQLETQKINQPVIFEAVTKKSVCLPLIKDQEDYWYCQRIINEAMISLHQHSTGPVHINVPLIGDTNELNILTRDVNKVNRIEYYPNTNYSVWESAYHKIIESKRVLIVMGQHLPMSEQKKTLMRQFVAMYHIPVLTDNMSNFHCDQMIMAEALIKGLNSKTIEPLLPEIVITIGANFQERIKDLMKANQCKFEHWGIDSDGVVRDVFRSQTALFESTEDEFFEYFSNKSGCENCSERKEYLELWKKYEAAVKLPELPWTNLYVAGEFCKKIPQNSILHLAILNSVRVHQFFKLDESISVFANVNTFGIDGCLPTFMGQACATDKLAFIVIGDLSFFYGMNALGIKHVGNNVRVMVMNNRGAAEFHIPPDSHNRPTVDLHIGCAHERSAKGWAESLGYIYLSATDSETLSTALDQFTRADYNSPVLLEVFTDKSVDGPNMLSVYRHLEKCITSMD